MAEHAEELIQPRLVTAVDDALAFLWREYVVSDPRTLSGDARSLREQLKSTFSRDASAA
jgi:hypothetical protein